MRSYDYDKLYPRPETKIKMSKLISLKISGLRSFGIREEDVQTIKLFTPMTLFLGQNGCGKTTIMEAIKHACTGDIPGGTNAGQGFVSNPYLHRVQQCKGQVQLTFSDVRGNLCKIERVMSSEQKLNNELKFSTLDSAIKYTSGRGEVRTLSGRIQDLNTIATDLLGVPIINNVIFCHQEDSLWPLGEGGAVKKKFDAIFDSFKYDRAVDSRMVEINSNIRELWRTIYKGNDIDFIEINADIYTTGSKRQYKYRVMAKRNESLIEMRGRCSASQKVLASLIIRIALSESFSKNCGILALDDPTTNLDRKHIQGLSDCLADIVNSRRSQSNFQLIVITHDEEFLSTLRRIDSLRNYYEVSRNINGSSVVTLKTI